MVILLSLLYCISLISAAMCDKLGQFLNDCSPVLFNAAKDGNVDRIRKLVGAMPQEALKRYLNKPFTNGATPLIIAARNGHSKCVEYLVNIELIK